MIKKLFCYQNLTGRIYLCIDSDNELLDNPSNNFVVGENYYEAIVDNDGENYINKGENVILLLNKDNIPLHVNADSFIEINDQVLPIVIGPYCVN